VSKCILARSQLKAWLTANSTNRKCHWKWSVCWLLSQLLLAPSCKFSKRWNG